MAEKKFRDRTFKVEPMLATKALVLQARLMKVAGPAMTRLGEIMQGYGKEASEHEKAVSNVAAISAFADIFSNTSPEELAFLIGEVLETALIQRPSGSYDPVDVDGDFTGKMEDLVPVTVWVLQEQFGSFFAGLLAAGSRGR